MGPSWWRSCSTRPLTTRRTISVVVSRPAAEAGEPFLEEAGGGKGACAEVFRLLSSNADLRRLLSSTSYIRYTATAIITPPSFPQPSHVAVVVPAARAGPQPPAARPSPLSGLQRGSHCGSHVRIPNLLLVNGIPHYGADGRLDGLHAACGLGSCGDGGCRGRGREGVRCVR